MASERYLIFRGEPNEDGTPPDETKIEIEGSISIEDQILAGMGITITVSEENGVSSLVVSLSDEYKTKIDGIQENAEMNVQADWTETDISSDAYIQNKPTIVGAAQSDWDEADSTSPSYILNKPSLFSGSYDDLTDKPNIADEITEDDIYDFNVAIITEGSGVTIDDDDTSNTITISVTNEFTSAHETKLDGIEDNAQVNVQPDWTK